MKKDNVKVRLEGGEGETDLQFDFGWCHEWKFRWRVIGMLGRAVDWVATTLSGRPVLGLASTSPFSESFSTAWAELMRGFGEEVWRARKRIGRGGMGGILLIERMARHNGGERDDKEDAKNVLEQRVMKILSEGEQLRDRESTRILDLQNAMKKSSTPRSKHILGYYPCRSERFNAQDAENDENDVPQGNFVILDVAEFGDLRHFCENRQPLPEPVCSRFFRGLIHGLDAMASVRWIHRDIKLENLLLNRRGETVLCDFGLSQWICTCTAPPATGGGMTPRRHGEAWRCDAHDMRKCDKNTRAEASCFGTAPYLAPESLTLFHFSTASDVWAAGAVLLELATGTRVLQTNVQTAEGILGNVIEREGASAAIAKHVAGALATKTPHMLSLLQVRSFYVGPDVLSDEEFAAKAKDVDGDARIEKKELEKQGVRLQLLSPTLTDLLERMLECDPAKRIGIAGIKQHRWWLDTEAASEPALAKALERQDPVHLKRLFSELPEIRRAVREPASRVGGSPMPRAGGKAGRFVACCESQMWKNRRLTEFLSIVAADQEGEKGNGENSGKTFYEDKLRPLYHALQVRYCCTCLFVLLACCWLVVLLYLPLLRMLLPRNRYRCAFVAALPRTHAFTYLWLRCTKLCDGMLGTPPQDEICTFAEFKNVKATEAKLEKIGLKKLGRSKVALRLRRIIARQMLRKVFFAARWICSFERSWTVCSSERRGVVSAEYRHKVGWPLASEPDGKLLVEAQQERVLQLQALTAKPARSADTALVSFVSARGVSSKLPLRAAREYATAAEAKLRLFEKLFGAAGNEDERDAAR